MIELIKNIFCPVKTELEVGAAASAAGTIFVYVTGTFDELIEALLLIMAIDYISGLIAAYVNPVRKLDSRRGFKGIGKKMMIMLLVAVAHIIDSVTGQQSVRTVIIFFFIGNEGLSVLENAAAAGVPVPDKLKASLGQFTEEKNKRRNKKDNM